MTTPILTDPKNAVRARCFTLFFRVEKLLEIQMLLTGTIARRRLLEVIRARGLHTAGDINKFYNNRYPPSRLGRLFGKGMSVRSTLKHLDVLCEAGLVRKELLVGTSTTIDRRIAHFTITSAGLHQLATRT